MSDAELRPLLDELERRLRAFGAPVAEALRPGAPPGRVEEELAREGLLAHQDLRAWWGWHDGVGDEAGPDFRFRPETTLIGPWHVLSLTGALGTRRWHRDEYAAAGAPEFLPETWLPVLLFEGRPVLGADVAASGDAPLLLLDEGVLPPLPVLFDSLADFVRSVLGLFDAGLVRPHAGAPWFEATELEGDLRRLAFF